jgi:hypothetical protein
MKLQCTPIFSKSNVVYDEGVLDPRARSIIDSSLPVPTDDHVLSTSSRTPRPLLSKSDVVLCTMMRKETTDPSRKGHCFPRVLEIEALEAEEQSKSNHRPAKYPDQQSIDQQGRRAV